MWFEAMESKITHTLDEQEIRSLLRRYHYLSSSLFIAAALVLMISIFLPYWELTLEAPQYPDGLKVNLFVNRVTGDVSEVDGLNHYIGMKPLDEAAKLERTMSIFAIISLSLITASAILVHNKWAALLSLPVLLYPLIFVADLYFWLRLFGQNLDSTAPLSSSVEPFTQPLMGAKVIANFVTYANFGNGFYLACIGVILLAVALYTHRRNYKPLTKAIQEGSYLRQLSDTNSSGQ